MVTTNNKAVEEEEKTAPAFEVKVGDEVLYCTGYKDTGEKDETGNRVLVADYAPAQVFQVDAERAETGHVLLVYTDAEGRKLSAWAHNGAATPGYWTFPNSEPK